MDGVRACLVNRTMASLFKSRLSHLEKSYLWGVRNYRQTLTGASLSCKLDFNSRMRRRSLVASLPASKRWLCNRSRARTLSPTLSLWLHFAKGIQLISSLECVVCIRPVGPHRILGSAYHVRCVSLKLLRQKPNKLVNKRTTARNLTGWSTKGIYPQSHLEFRDPCIFSWLSLAQDSGTDLLQSSSCTI